jgi:hypothetical protein
MKISNQCSFTEAESLNPSALRNFSNVCRAKLEAFKTNLVHRLTAEFSGLQSYLVRRAVEEADDLAAATGIPFLVLPTLAEEKVRNARELSLRQNSVFQPSVLSRAA